MTLISWFRRVERKMIDELIDILEHLQSVDTRMDKLWMKAWESFRITEEWIEQKKQEFLAESRPMTHRNPCEPDSWK